MLTSSINLHESFHEFRAHQGTSTAIMNVKQLIQSIQRDINPMYMSFFDVKNAYNTVDWDRILQLLQSYGVGPNMLYSIAKIWQHDKLIPKQNKYFGNTIPSTRGVR
jgi:Reverse transcriptase (RNA-dependent DNA polymerase)